MRKNFCFILLIDDEELARQQTKDFFPNRNVIIESVKKTSWHENVGFVIRFSMDC